MGNKMLQDLDMAGVHWELSETPYVHNAKKPVVQQNLLSGNDEKVKTNIIPATAPITIDTVKSMVARPNDTDSLLRMVAEFNHPLRNGATNVVMPNIAQKPNGLLIITDVPSSDDDLSGRILSGPAGELTDKMLAAIEMSRENVSIISLLFWRTPGGHTPSREDLDLSRPFVKKLIEMLAPKIIITFGTLASAEFSTQDYCSENNCQIFSMYHPNYLILKPSAKKEIWPTLQNIQKMLKNS